MFHYCSKDIEKYIISFLSPTVLRSVCCHWRDMISAASPKKKNKNQILQDLAREGDIRLIYWTLSLNNDVLNQSFKRHLPMDTNYCVKWHMKHTFHLEE
jgi:hypothetical protein